MHHLHMLENIQKTCTQFLQYTMHYMGKYCSLSVVLKITNKTTNTERESQAESDILEVAVMNTICSSGTQCG